MFLIKKWFNVFEYRVRGMENKGFLNKVADKIFEKESNNFQNILIVFPNKRAIRFFREYIVENLSVGESVFLPDMQSIDTLIKNSLFDMQRADNLQLLYILYKVYCKQMYPNTNDIQEKKDDNETINVDKDKENFDEFYFWGNVLLNDFDQIDKELVDAKALYRNLKDFKDLEADPQGYLTKEQIELVNRLFNTTLSAEDNGGIRKDFVQVWNKLYEIYEKFNKVLDEKHLAYSGKMYREFVRRLKDKQITLPYKQIKFIGFSVLNNSEKNIFGLLKEGEYETEFYWDYDNYYVQNEQNEAGIFIRENLSCFPQSEDLKDETNNNIQTNDFKINVISSAYETTSLAYISSWLEDMLSQDTQSDKESKEELEEKHTKENKLNKCAIILNEESLVPLVIKSIDSKYKDKINITMGYPFNQTWLYHQVCSRLNDLADNNKFAEEEVFLSLKELSENVVNDNKEQKLWQLSALEKVCKVVINFISVIDDIQQEDLSPRIIKSVLKKELSSLNLDIISEGTSGIQLMGLLETRVLDFENILMLSTNDDNIPKLTKDTSFIPYSFRKAYQMMNPDRKAGVFAYYFYRLLHNVKRMDYLYTTIGGENKLKEKSRFLRQIEIELPQKRKDNFLINYKNLIAKKALRSLQKEYLFEKDHLLFINNGTKALSASALNDLIHCQQKFYLKHIKYLREDIKDEDYLAIAFGNVFHGSINIFYERLDKNKKYSPNDIDNLIKYSIDKYFSEQENEKDKRVCANDIYIAMIKKYIKDIYLQDCKEKNVYLCGEKEYSVDLNVNGDIVHLKSRLDRMDYIVSSEGCKILRILDYKTGRKKDATFEFFDNLTKNPDDEKPRKDGTENIFEIMFYCYLVYNSNKEKEIIKPELMYLTDMNDRDIKIGKGKYKQTFYYDEQANKEFEQCLKDLLYSLINKQKEEKYEAIMSEDKCRYCDYKLLCRLGKKENI